MSRQEIALTMTQDGDTLHVAVSGLAPFAVARTSRSVCRGAGDGLFRVRTTVSDETSALLLLSQELFIDAVRERWSDWFTGADTGILDDAAEPVISITGRGERVATLLSDAEWPDQADEVSLRLTGARFDGGGLAVIWTMRAPESKPKAEPEAPAAAANSDALNLVPEPVFPDEPGPESDVQRKRRERRERLARKIAAALEDSEPDD